MSWRRYFRRTKWDVERAREMEAHLAIEAEENIARGMAPEEARYAAMRKLGNQTRIREEIYEMNTIGFLETLWQDLRYGARSLRKSLGFTAVAVLTLALGIGANTTIFSVINAVLLRPLPFPDANRLALVWECDAHDSTNWNIVSAPNFWDYQKQSDVFESMAIFDSGGRGYNLSQGSDPERVSGVRVSSQFFTVLGVQPLLGRGFLPDEESAGNDHEVVLSYPLWMRRYAGDPSLVGKTIRIDGESFTVVGIMPREFQFQFWSNPRELWVPVGYTEGDKERGGNSFVSIARLKPGITISQAASEMDTIGRRLMKQYPYENAGRSATVTSLSTFNMEGLRRSLLSLLAAVGLVLLIACLNVANLSLAKGAARQKELAVRRALGAGRLRILRQLLTESLLLAALGAIAGLFVAASSIYLLGGILPPELRFAPFRPLKQIPLDLHVLAFALAATCLTGILCGLAPALSACRRDLNDPLKEGSGRGATQAGGKRLRHGLVAAEVALALVVLAGAGLVIDSVSRLMGVNPGFNPRNALSVDITTPQKNLYNGPPVNGRFCDELQEHVGAIPGVIAVGAASGLPLQGLATRSIAIEGEPDPGAENQPGAKYTIACPNYFKAMGIPIEEGREFTDRDALGSPGVVVISESMAHRFWPKRNAVGQRFKLGLFNSDSPWLTIVGVSRDVRSRGLDRESPVEFFRPFPQAAWPTMTIVVRTVADPFSYLPLVKKAIAETNPEVPVSGVQSLEEVVTDSVGERRFPMLLLSTFAGLALLLAAVGIYGVVSYGVTQRTQEIGIRMAFGAQPRHVVRLVVGSIMAWTIAGVVIGIAGAFAATRLLADLLYGISATDPFVLGAVSLLLCGVSLLASYLPARRAMRVDPMVALRYE
jgi:putative ABC transport system permease protein